MSLRVRSYKSFTFGEFKGHPTLEIDSDSWNMHYTLGKSKAKLFLANMPAIEQHVNDSSYYKPDMVLQYDEAELILTPARVRQIYRWRHVISRWVSGGSFKSVRLATVLDNNRSDILIESLQQEFIKAKHSYACWCSSAFRSGADSANPGGNTRAISFVFNEHSGSLYDRIAEMHSFVKRIRGWMPDILDAQAEQQRIQHIHLDECAARIKQANAAIDYYKQLNMNQTTNQHV